MSRWSQYRFNGDSVPSNTSINYMDNKVSSVIKLSMEINMSMEEIVTRDVWTAASAEGDD